MTKFVFSYCVFLPIVCVLGLTENIAISRPRPRCTRASPRYSGSSTLQNPRNLLRWYDHQLRRAPLRTKMVSSGAVSAVGDAAAQLLTGGSFDLRRSIAWILCGSFYFAPFLHLWYGMLASLETRAQQRYGLPKSATIAAQLLANQSIGAGIINALFFYVFEVAHAIIGLLVLDTILLHPHQIVTAATHNLQAKFATIMIVNWCIWPLPSLLNLVYVPLQYRVLFTNGVALIWKCVLSLMTANQMSRPMSSL